MDEIEQQDKTPNESETQDEQSSGTQEDVLSQYYSPESQTQHTGEKPASSSGKKLGGLAALAAILFKFKAVIFFALTKFKFLFLGLKFAKVFTTMGSMLVTIVVDAMRWGWAFAVGFVMLIFIHEMGHVLALRMKGIKAGAPVFIPFVGAMIALKEMPQDAKSEAEIGIAGPLLGTAGALLCLQLGGGDQFSLFTRLAYVGFFLNLFNLLPVLPLDGGRVMAAISPKVWILGLVLAVFGFIWSHNPILIILVVLSIGRMWHAMKMPPEEREYYNVPAKTRLQMTALYFGLAGFLAWQMLMLHHPQPHNVVPRREPMRVTQVEASSFQPSAYSYQHTDENMLR